MARTRGIKMVEEPSRGRGRRGRGRNQMGRGKSTLATVEELEERQNVQVEEEVEEDETIEPLIRRSSKIRKSISVSEDVNCIDNMEKTTMGSAMNLNCNATGEIENTNVSNVADVEVEGMKQVGNKGDTTMEEDGDRDEDKETDDDMQSRSGREYRSEVSEREEENSAEEIEEGGEDDEEDTIKLKGTRGSSYANRGRTSSLSSGCNRKMMNKKDVKHAEKNMKKVQNTKVRRRIDDYFTNEQDQQGETKKTDFVIKEEDWHKDKKTATYAKYDILVDVKKLCTNRVISLLEESCLKNVIRMSVRKFPPKLIQHLMGKNVKNEDPNELSFKIGGEIYTFGLREFCMITGLECSPVKNVDLDALPQSELLETIFEGFENLDWYDLHDGFKSCDFSDEELSLKLAKLYLVESLVVAKQYQTFIEKMHFRLVEVDAAFNTYSWGRLSFNLLIASLKKVSEFPRRKFQRLSGFPQALVIWACELLPALSLNSKYARRIGNEHPRMLNWDYTKQGTWTSYQNDVFNEPVQVHPIIPSEEEVETHYLKPIIEEYGRKESDFRRKKNNVNEESVVDPINKSMMEDMKIIIEQNHMMKQSLMDLSKKVEDLKGVVLKTMVSHNTKEGNVIDNQEDGERFDEGGVITDLRSDKDEYEITRTRQVNVVGKQIEKSVKELGERNATEEDTNIGNKRKDGSRTEDIGPSLGVKKSKRLKKVAWNIREPFTDDFGKKKKQTNGPTFHLLTPPTQEE